MAATEGCESPRVRAAAPAAGVLHPRVVWLWRLSGFAGVLIVLGASGAVSAVLLDAPPSATLLLLAGTAGLVATWGGARLRYATWRFTIDASELRIRRGVLVRTTSVVPFARIQHVDTRQDVLERWLGLARIVVYTAGIRGAEITVPGLAVGDAEALRDRLAVVAGAPDRAV